MGSLALCLQKYKLNKLTIMPAIYIEYDNQKVTDADAQALSEAIQKIVSEITSIDDVFVYANSAQIKIGVAPIEIFIKMTANKIADTNKLIADIKLRLIEWKGAIQFIHPINLTLIPMQWKIELGI